MVTRRALGRIWYSPDPRWVISVPFNEGGGGPRINLSAGAYAAAVTFNDVMAAGIMRILHQRGVSASAAALCCRLMMWCWPVSLSGVNNVHYPVSEQMARYAAQLAIQVMRGITPAAARQQSFQCRTGDPRFCRATYFHDECVVSGKNFAGDYQIYRL